MTYGGTLRPNDVEGFCENEENYPYPSYVPSYLGTQVG